MSGCLWFVYLAKCSDGTYYCGIAKDVAHRIAQHDAGKGAKYTRGRGPLVLIWTKACRSQGDALRLERKVKKRSRKAKERMGHEVARMGAVEEIVLHR